MWSVIPVEKPTSGPPAFPWTAANTSSKRCLTSGTTRRASSIKSAPTTATSTSFASRPPRRRACGSWSHSAREEIRDGREARPPSSVLQHRAGVLVAVLFVRLGIKIRAALLQRLVLFVGNAVGIGPGVLTNAGDLPGDLGARLAPGDLEAVAADLARNVQARLRSANRRQLIAEVAVERLEVLRKLDPRLPARIEACDAVVDVHHVRRFDKGVRQIFVGGVERIVNLERAAQLAQVAIDLEIAIDRDGAAKTAAATIDLKSAVEPSITAAVHPKRVLARVDSGEYGETASGIFEDASDSSRTRSG